MVDGAKTVTLSAECIYYYKIDEVWMFRVSNWKWIPTHQCMPYLNSVCKLGRVQALFIDAPKPIQVHDVKVLDNSKLIYTYWAKFRVLVFAGVLVQA